MSVGGSSIERAKAALRFDGLWWRKFAYLGCVYGPEWWKRGSPPAIAAILFASVKANREAAIANMQRILGCERAAATWAALRMYAQFAHCMTETMESFGPHPRPIRLDLPPTDLIRDALRAGRGAVLVTGHIGNWDIAAKTLRDHDQPINLVMARETNATMQDFAREMRERGGVRVIYSDSSVFSALNMIRALRQNEIVAIQLDRMLTLGGARAVPFFGAPALFPSGPFVLARLAGSPLIPVFIPRVGTRHYAIRYGTALNLPREARDGYALERAMRSVVGDFEAVIRAFPTQWFQFTPFWQAAAAGPATQPAAPTDESLAEPDDAEAAVAAPR